MYIDFLKEYYPSLLEKRYGIADGDAAVSMLSKVAESRNCIGKGGEPDMSKAAQILVDDFRSGRLGRITLEFPSPRV